MKRYTKADPFRVDIVENTSTHLPGQSMEVIARISHIHAQMQNPLLSMTLSVPKHLWLVQ